MYAWPATGRPISLGMPPPAAEGFVVAHPATNKLTKTMT